MKMSSAFTIREFTTQEEFLSLHPFLQLLNPDMSRALFEQRLAEMLPAGYRCIGAFDAQDECVGITGFWMQTRFYCGKYVDVDNVIIKKEHQGNGLGAQLMRWVEEEARRQGCECAMLDSYTPNAASHKFYFREGYYILGYHFFKHFEKPELPRRV